MVYQQQTRNSGWQGSDGVDDYLVKVGEPVGLMYGFVTDGFYKIDDFNYNATTGVYTIKTGIAAKWCLWRCSARFIKMERSEW